MPLASETRPAPKFLTYRELAELIAKMTDEQKDQDVTVLDCYDDEYFPVKGWGVNEEGGGQAANSDVLDKDQYYLYF